MKIYCDSVNDNDDHDVGTDEVGMYLLFATQYTHCNNIEFIVLIYVRNRWPRKEIQICTHRHRNRRRKINAVWAF